MTASPTCSQPSSPTGPTAQRPPSDVRSISPPLPVQSPIQILERVYGGPSLDQDGVKLITLAPDVEGIMACIPNLAARGVTVSIGHSDASLDVGTEAVQKGARMITHLFKYVALPVFRDVG